jgi:CBS domain
MEANMAGPQWIADIVSTDFDTLPVDQASRRLGELAAGTGIAVVVDSQGRPTASIDSSGHRPLVLVPAHMSIDTLLDTPGLADILDSDVPAVVVDASGRPVGVLTADRLAEALADYKVRTELMGDHDSYRDAVLHGNPAAPEPLDLVCRTCGAPNRVIFYVAGQTACANGHPLVVDWQE